MDTETRTAPAAEPKQRRRRSASAASKRTSYKQQAATLQGEVERLQAKVQKLERAANSQPGSSLEPSLIIDALGDSYRAGLQTGLLLQGSK